MTSEGLSAVFDIGWQELFIVVAIAIIVVGPRDLPRVLKSITGYISKARSMVREFQSGIDEVVREVDLEEIKKEAENTAKLDFEAEVNSALKPVKAIESDLNDVNMNLSAELPEKVSEPVTQKLESADPLESGNIENKNNQPISSNKTTNG